jgi:hypothetical protein
MAPGAIFTTLNFLCNLQMDQEARVFVTRKPFQFSVILHSSLLGAFVSYEENEVL